MTPVRQTADLDPSTLSTQQRRALRIMSERRIYRRPGGYGRAPFTVSLDVSNSLCALGLARKDLSGMQHELVLTYLGKTLQAVIEQRAQRRKKA
jgi:hypothetical protein